MSLFVDSVEIEEVRAALDLGFVAGVTTNPGLIAKSGRPAEQVIESLCRLFSRGSEGIVFHQVTGDTSAELEAEAHHFLALSRGRIALKIPCSLAGMRLVQRFRARATCAVTAVYTPAQAYLCAQAGARYAIPYVNRAARQGLDALGLVRAMADVVDIGAPGQERCEVLAASVKSPDEAVEVLRAGARHLTLPWPVIESMAEHQLTAQALAEFAAMARAEVRP